MTFAEKSSTNMDEPKKNKKPSLENFHTVIFKEWSSQPKPKVAVEKAKEKTSEQIFGEMDKKFLATKSWMQHFINSWKYQIHRGKESDLADIRPNHSSISYDLRDSDKTWFFWEDKITLTLKKVNDNWKITFHANHYKDWKPMFKSKDLTTDKDIVSQAMITFEWIINKAYNDKIQAEKNEKAKKLNEIKKINE